MVQVKGDALEWALALAKSPAERVALRQRTLPDGMQQLLEIAGDGNPDAVAEFAVQTGEDAADIIEAARFYAREVLFHHAEDAYRVLGVSPLDNQETLRTHYRLLQQWLHPDRHTSDWDAIFAARVNAAWGRLRSDQRRQDYDRENPPQHRDQMPAKLVSPTWLHPQTMESGETDLDRWRRRAPVLALFAVCCVLAILAMRDVQRDPALISEQAKVENATAEVASAQQTEVPVELRIPDLVTKQRVVLRAELKPTPKPVAVASAPKTAPQPVAMIAKVKPSPKPSAIVAVGKPAPKPVVVGPAVKPTVSRGVAVAAPARNLPKPVVVAATTNPAPKPVAIVAAAKPLPPPVAVATQPTPRPVLAATPAKVLPKPIAVAVEANPARKPITVDAPAKPAHTSATVATTLAVTTSRVPVVDTSSPSNDATPASTAVESPEVAIQRTRLAQQVGGQLMSYIAQTGSAVPPIWGSLTTQRGASQLRGDLHEAGNVKLDSPDWRVGDSSASMQANIRYQDGRIGRLSAKFAWREQRWLVTGLSVERDL